MSGLILPHRLREGRTLAGPRNQRGFIINPYMFESGGGDVDTYFSYVASLLPCNGLNGGTDFPDITGKSWTSSSITTNTTRYKFGGSSGLVGGSNSYLKTPSDTDFDFGSDEFTVEAWVRRTSGINTYQNIICRDSIGGTRGWLLFFNNANNELAFTGWVGATPYQVADSVGFVDNVWTHVAAVRQNSGGGDVLRLYKSGIEVASGSISGSVGAPSAPLVIGSLWGTSGPLSNTNLFGNFGPVRLTNGVCRYPAGTTFTPPTTAFPTS